MRLIHCLKNSIGEATTTIQLPPTGFLPHMWELWEVQFKMRFGWGHGKTISGYDLILRLVIFKSIKNKCWQKCEEKGILVQCW